MTPIGKPKPKEWGPVYEAERLIQLHADTQHVSHAVWDLYYGLSVKAPPDMAPEWVRKAEEVRLVLGSALTEIERLIGDCYGNRS